MELPRFVPGPAAPAGQRAGRWLAGAALLLAAAALLTYRLTPYAALRDWYLRLTPDLYRAAAWPTAFFTPATKSRGDLLATLGLLALPLLAGAAWRWGPRPLPGRRWQPWQGLGRADAPWLAGLLALGAAAWGWGAATVPPAYDEVFSATYCAGSRSVLVALSYYMLPNNHVLFNVLNGALFGRWLAVPGLLLTGRALSGLAYGATLALVYRLGAGLTGRRWAGAALAGLAGAQYSLWGFGFEARGYALYALCHWVALAALLAHWRGRRGATGWLAAAIAVGYATVPTFLFAHAALTLAGAGRQLARRRFDPRFWLAQAGALALVGAFYAPVIGFSGLGALTANPYVRPVSLPLAEFARQAWPDFKSYATFAFGPLGMGDWPDYVLALLPLTLLAGRRWRWLGVVYGCWLLVLPGGTLALRHVVFHRNLLGLFSVALVLAPLAAGALAARLHRRAGWVVALLVGGFVALKAVGHGPVRNPSSLYFYDVPGQYAAARQRLRTLPATGTVAFSEESFYPWFLYRQGGGAALSPAHRPVPAADYFLTAPNDALPPAVASQYAPVDTVGTYRLWRRRGR